MHTEVLSWDPNRGELLVQHRGEEFRHSYRTAFIDVLEQPGVPPRDLAIAMQEADGYTATYVYWHVAEEGERFVQYVEHGTLHRTYTDAAPGPGERVGWTFRADPRVKVYRPRARGLHTRPRRASLPDVMIEP